MIYRCINCGGEHDSAEPSPCKPKEEEKRSPLNRLIRETERMMMESEGDTDYYNEALRRAYDIGVAQTIESVRYGTNKAMNAKIAEIAARRDDDELFEFIEDCDG